MTIGANSTIGGNVGLLRDVPPDSVVTQPEATVLARTEGIALRATLDRVEA